MKARLASKFSSATSRELFRISKVLSSCVLLCGLVAAQDLNHCLTGPTPSIPAAASALPQAQAIQLFQVKSAVPGQGNKIAPMRGTTAYSETTVPSDGPRCITLDQAKQQADSAENPMIRLGELQVEAARQHRLGTESDYFPKLSSTFTNFHFNKFMGESVEIQRPVAGGTTTVGLPLAGKDQTFVAVTAAQPLTPLLKIREVVRLAEADENIARAKAGMPVSEVAADVEKQYYGLLVAQRQLSIAKANIENVGSKLLLASSAAVPGEMPDHSVDDIKSAKAIVLAESKVKELIASLNLLLGYPVETQLDLVPPAMQFEDLSLKEASDKAMAANPDVVEAEQTVVKARAGARLSKLDYVPDFALLGGYAYNDNALPLLPRDFSFIGIMGSFNLFDFGKREHTVKERSAQLSAAELALQLTKAKVAAAVKNSYFELDRSRQLSELAHRMSSALTLQRANYSPQDSELSLTKAKLEVEMFQADLDYRQALMRLKTLFGEQ